MIKINEKKDCCGCGACASICAKHCITMVSDNEGFLYPCVDETACTDCGLCEMVCPVINEEADHEKHQRAFLLQHKDEKVLEESTSGGAFTVIASWVIERGGVVFGAAYGVGFEVCHQFVETIDDLKIFRNSKYVQSRIGDSFKKVKECLQAGRWVCFSDTPCQLEGLLHYLHKPYEKLLTVDVMCHSVTSPMTFKAYVSELCEKVKCTPDNIMFRDKKPYGYKYSQMSAWKDGKQIYNEGVETDAYLRSFFTDMNVRPSCYDCKFKKQYHMTDFTIWDCFDVYKFCKELDNDKGVTRILTNTERAVEILIDSSDNAKVVEIPVEKAVEGVKEMRFSVRFNAKRNKLFDNKIVTGRGLSSCYPITSRARIEKTIRITAIKLGIYSWLKCTAKTFIKELRRS